MRRFLTALAILLLASPLLAQTGGNAGSTKAAQEFAKALTANTHFGVPRYTTVALPTCETANTGAVAFNTTSGFLTFCNGTSWGDANSGAASAVTPGSTTVGTSVSCVMFANGVSVLQCASDLPGQVNISGPDAATNVEIGGTTNDANAGTGGTSVVIGNGATNSGNGTADVVIGSAATLTAGNATVVIGANAVGGNGSNVIIGQTATAAAASANNIVIGRAATAANGAGNNLVLTPTAGAANTGGSNVVLGSQASAGALSNVFTAGGLTTPINNVYFGKGVTHTTATAFTINGTGGSGADNAGAGVVLAAGKGTGTAAGGDIQIQRSPSIATGSTAQTLSDAVYIRSQMKALTAATQTPFARINVAAFVAGLSGWTGGTVFYTLVANDATNAQSRSGSANFSIVNVGGTEVCAFGTTTTESIANSSGTTTLSFDTDTTGPTNGCDLRATGASSLTETTLALFYSIVLNGPGTVTPQ